MSEYLSYLEKNDFPDVFEYNIRKWDIEKLAEIESECRQYLNVVSKSSSTFINLQILEEYGNAVILFGSC